MWNPDKSKTQFALRKVVLAELVGQCVWFSVVVLEYFGGFEWFVTLSGVVFCIHCDFDPSWSCESLNDKNWAFRPDKADLKGSL